MRSATTRLAALLALALTLGASPAMASAAEYRIEEAAAQLSSTQAGAHADLTLLVRLSEDKGAPLAQTRDIEFALPQGVIGNPQGIPRCTVAQLGTEAAASECPTASQVGVTEVRVSGLVSGTFTEPIYNMEPPGGDIVARLGFFPVVGAAFVNIRFDPVTDSLVGSVEGAPSASGLLEAKTTLWGVPADKSHDEERLTPQEAAKAERPAPPGRSAGIPPAPFLSNPTDCSTQRTMTVSARSYQGTESKETVPFPQITGCGKLSFEPRFSLIPTNPEAAAPTGVDATLEIPQDETPEGRATSTLRSAVVSLPEGMAINPAAGDGLAACSAEQAGFERPEASHCPDAAKIGTVEVEVPALERTLKGAVYQRTPEPGNLFRFWVLADEQGVHLKLPAEIQANPLSGQVTTVFKGLDFIGGLPQVPFSELRLHVFGGPRAPLATPASCGTYQSDFEFTPWSGKPASRGQTAMQISQGCGKGGFAPGLVAGSLNSSAAKFSPFTLTLTRSDGEANPQSLEVALPQGLLAKLAGVPLCPEAQAPSGACPAASQIGTIAAAAGVGGAPLWIPQPGKAPTAVYLAGPYKGAPYSIVARVPAQAGPFDLGVVVNRAGIYVDPETAVATVRTDPLPQILQGVPIAYRAINVLVNRPNFTLNPTGCNEKKVQAHVLASNGATANPSAGFQATNCAKLKYSPKLKLTFKGKTKRTGHPAVKAVLTQPPGQANTAAATTLLPSSEFIDQNHINNPCTRVQFNANACPSGSILGTVEATTPLLDQPLKGQIIFRSNGGERELPDVVADLNGQIHVILVGFVDSVGKKGSEVRRIRVRFLNAPDAPVTKFTLSFYGGKRGLLVNSTNLCVKKRTAKLTLTAQNELSRSEEVPIATGCGGKGPAT